MWLFRTSSHSGFTIIYVNRKAIKLCLDRQRVDQSNRNPRCSPCSMDSRSLALILIGLALHSSMGKLIPVSDARTSTRDVESRNISTAVDVF